MVGMQMRDEHLVELVHRQLQTGEIRQRPGPEIKHDQIPLSIPHLDQNAPRRLSPRHPRIATAKHRRPQLIVLEPLLARNERLRILPPRITNNRRRRDRSAPTRELGHRQRTQIFAGHDRTLSCVARTPRFQIRFSTGARGTR
jgi:hypothetical protein